MRDWFSRIEGQQKIFTCRRSCVSLLQHQWVVSMLAWRQARLMNIFCQTLAVGVNLRKSIRWWCFCADEFAAAHLVVIKGVHTFQNNASTEYSDLDVMQMLGRAVSVSFGTFSCALTHLSCREGRSSVGVRVVPIFSHKFMLKTRQGRNCNNPMWGGARAKV